MSDQQRKYNTTEKEAAQLWRGFRRNEQDAFWQSYDKLTQQAKSRQNPAIQTAQKRQATAPLAHKKTSDFSALWVLRQVATLFLVLGVCGFVGYAFFSVVEANQVLPTTWKGYTSDTVAKETYALYNTKKLLELKSKVVSFELQERRLTNNLENKTTFTGQERKTDKKALKKIFQPVLDDVRQKLAAHQQSLQVAYAPLLKKQQHAEQIKDALFKDYRPQDRSALDSLYAYCQVQGVTIGKNTIEYYLKYGGGINFRRKPYNLSPKNEAVYRLFGRRDTCIYFYADTSHTLHRVKKLKEGYYTFESHQLVNIDPTQHHIYQARLLPMYQGYQIKATHLGLYYETEKAQYYIPKQKHKYIGIELKIDIHQKAKQE